MWKFLLIAISIAALSTESCRVIEEKANGVTIERDSNSGFVLIEAFNGYDYKNLCAGILISPQFVLSSASCVFGTTFVNIHVYAYKLRDNYEESREIHKVESSKIHLNEYDGSKRINDIALIKMPSSFYTTGKTYLQTFASIPTSVLQAEATGSTIGWGLLAMKDDNAAALKQELSLTVISEAECMAAYPNLSWTSGAQGRACVKRSSSGTNCVSDVGSPFLIGGAVSGLQSHGQVEACETEVPNLIQDVFYHAEWIRSITESA
jgi:secreted trypsin-like serine protease